jgi:hypothetical protein
VPRRVALLVATYEYEDSMLEQLKGPAQDVEVLANVLSDPNIAGFDVDVLINQPHYVVGEAIGDFYQDRRRDDIALLYFTGHGLKDEEGRLYFAMKNTRRDRLLFTAIQANQIDEAIESCSSLQKVPILDCCYSGAFPAGRIAKGDSSVNSLETFRGKGRVVLTASDSTQYAFEGDRVSGKGQGSVFTRHLVGGLRTGEADLNGDGNITVDELYTFARDHVIEEMPNQHPKRQEDVEGAIILAQNVKWDFPSYVRHSLTSPIAADRLSALDSLTRLYRIGNETVRTRVIAEAHKMVEDDSRLVSSAAADLLAEARRTGEDDRTEEAARQPAEDERQRAPDERGGSQPRLTTAAVAPDGGSDGPTTHEQVAREMPAESPISGQSPVALAGKSDVLSTDVPPTQPVRERGFRRVVLVLMAGLVLAAVLVVGIRGLNFSWPPSSTGVPTPSRSTAAQPRPTPSPSQEIGRWKLHLGQRRHLDDVVSAGREVGRAPSILRGWVLRIRQAR